MTNRQKEWAYDDFMDMILKSWTWERLTGDERNIFVDKIMDHQKLTARGTWKQRWQFYQALYSAYLYGLGYNGSNWRENEMVIWTCKPSKMGVKK